MNETKPIKIKKYGGLCVSFADTECFNYIYRTQRPALCNSLNSSPRKFSSIGSHRQVF